MNFPHGRGHIGIQSGNEGNARRAAHPRGANSGNGQAQHDSERRNDPSHANFIRHVTYALYDALQHADVVLADRNQQSQRRTDV